MFILPSLSTPWRTWAPGRTCANRDIAQRVNGERAVDVRSDSRQAGGAVLADDLVLENAKEVTALGEAYRKSSHAWSVLLVSEFHDKIYSIAVCARAAFRIEQW